MPAMELIIFSTKLTIKEIYKQFGNEDCIEGEIQISNGKIINFINGQSANVKKPTKNEKNQVIGSFFPDSPIKSPVQVLNELVKKVKNLADPYYHLENKEGPDHQAIFTVLLLIGGREFRSQGGSIKKAKNAAAQAALDSDLFPANISQTEPKSPGKIQEELTPISQLNNIALKLKMKVEYIREKYQRDAEIYRGSHKGFVNLGKKKSYEERLNASIYKTAKKGPNPDGDETKGPFTYLVKVGDKLQYRANGITKQGAKHNVAERAINSFKEMDLQDAIDCLREGTSCNVANVKSPINILQEMAAYRQFSITYTLITETGLPHKKTFGIRCEVLDGENKLFSDGEGSSKKEAKRIAAMKMVDKLSTLLVTNEGVKLDDYKESQKKKKKKNKINRSDLLLLKEDVANKIASVYDYFTAEDQQKAQKKNEGSQRVNDAKDKVTNEDFDSFDDTIDYKRRLHSILDDYALNKDYVELDEGHSKIVVLLVPTNPKLICIAEAVDISSAEELVSYHALKYILNNSDFQFKNFYQEGNMLSTKEHNVLTYGNINEKTD